MHSAANFDYLVKLLVIGDSGVGKSCMLLRYSDDQFSASYISTIGIDFKIKTTSLLGKKVKIQIWDTAGQERFRNITSAYYRGSMGILLVYDVADAKTFHNVTNWMKQIEINALPDVNTILIGNKCDVEEEQREVTFEQGEKLATEHGVRFMETSARTNINVTEAFEGLTTDVIERLDMRDKAEIAGLNSSVTLSVEDQKKRKVDACC